jgi:hypothetical protein
MTNFLPEQDGITHINIYSRGKTKLGRLLSNFAYAPFTLGNAGTFASVEAYWYWLLTGSEQVRSLFGFSAKQVGKRILSQKGFTEINSGLQGFKDCIRNAFTQKLAENPDIEKLLLVSELPLTHYYVFNGKKKEAGYEWQVKFWENLRSKLKGQANELF